MISKFSIGRDPLLNALLLISGAVERKKTLAILSHVLLSIENGLLTLVATDTEIEATANITDFESLDSGSITLPARKLVDICRSLPDGSLLKFSCKEAKVTVTAGKSRFTLATLSADDFPKLDDEVKALELNFSRLGLLNLLQNTHFCMAQQDVRYYLNGLLLDINENQITAVSTDGHRLAISQLSSEQRYEPHKIILPRKAVQELIRLLSDVEDETLSMAFSKQHFYVYTQAYTLVSRLIDGRFPSYLKVLPKNNDKEVVIDRDVFKRALGRASILANEQSRGISVAISPCLVTLIANNKEREEAIEELEATTVGDPLQIGVNASYLIDVLGNIASGEVRLSFSSPSGSILIESLADPLSQYIIMPMKI